GVKERLLEGVVCHFIWGSVSVFVSLLLGLFCLLSSRSINSGFIGLWYALILILFPLSLSSHTFLCLSTWMPLPCMAFFFFVCTIVANSIMYACRFGQADLHHNERFQCRFTVAMPICGRAHRPALPFY